MVTHAKKIRFKATIKNPLADKLRAKQARSILRASSTSRNASFLEKH